MCIANIRRIACQGISCAEEFACDSVEEVSRVGWLGDRRYPGRDLSASSVNGLLPSFEGDGAPEVVGAREDDRGQSARPVRSLLGLPFRSSAELGCKVGARRGDVAPCVVLNADLLAREGA